MVERGLVVIKWDDEEDNPNLVFAAAVLQAATMAGHNGLISISMDNTTDETRLVLSTEDDTAYIEQLYDTIVTTALSLYDLAYEFPAYTLATRH